MGFPFEKQRDAMQCGVAALAMVCRYHGLPCTVQELEGICRPTREGVSLKGIADAARELGLETRAGKLTAEALEQMPLPCILHWNQNHFVVLYGISRKGKRFRVADPAKGKTVYNRGEFCRGWLGDTPASADSAAAEASARKGIAMFLTPGEDFGTRSRMARRRGNPLRILMKYLGLYRRYFLQIFAGLLVACGLQLVFPFLTQAIVDVGIRDKSLSFIWLVLLGELMIVIGRTATDFIRRWLLLHISMRVNISLLSDFFIKLLRLPMAYFDTKLTGDLMQRIADHSRVQNFLTQQTLGVMFTTLSFLVFGVVLFIYDKVVFSIFLGGTAVYALWIASFLRRRRVLDYELFERQAANQNKTFRFITTMQEIKLQDCERRRRWEWEDAQAELFDVQTKALRLQQSQEAGSIFINEVKNILITVLAAAGVIDGSLTLGGMLAIQYIVGQLNSPVEQMMGFLQAAQDVKISLERINEVHNSRDEENGARPCRELPAELSVTFDRVAFRYDPHSPELTLRDVSLRFPAGKVTAVVGASGSGKTTLLKLILGYYPAESGEIRVGDRNLEEIDLRWWRRQCGVVMQEGVIFSESIERNIAADDSEVDTARMKEAARIANIDSFVESLPTGYRTVIGPDGTGLSQGQKQRILIARAVYRNPRFIFLDEATNSLDAGNEREIVRNLGEFYRGRTVIVVAHRLSTVRDADHIIVLNKGAVAEQGTHEELVRRRGAYYTLIRNQLELGN